MNNNDLDLLLYCYGGPSMGSPGYKNYI